MSKLCLIFNTAPRYRKSIYMAIDGEYDCVWYFGEKLGDIQEMDYSLLHNVNRYASYGNPSRFYWKKGILSLLFKKEYKTFFMLAESRSLTDYLFFGLSRLLKRNVYVWTHGWYGKESKIEAFLKKWQFNHVDGIFVYSNYGRGLMIEQGIPAEKVFTIHNSLHYDQQKGLRESITSSSIYKDHFKNENPILIFVGRLTKVKKLDLLIDAVYRLKQKNQFFNLVFIGDGEERKNLESKVETLGLCDKVWFYGACYDEKTNAELIYNADLCVAPGNIGLTAMHSMVFGTPCLTHNDFKWQMPEFEAIHEGVTGSFFERDNLDSMISAIEKWFRVKHGEREKIREACYQEIDTQWNPYFQMDVIKKNLKFE